MCGASPPLECDVIALKNASLNSQPELIPVSDGTCLLLDMESKLRSDFDILSLFLKANNFFFIGNNFATLFPGTLHLVNREGESFYGKQFQGRVSRISYPEEQRSAVLLIDLVGT